MSSFDLIFSKYCAGALPLHSIYSNDDDTVRCPLERWNPMGHKLRFSLIIFLLSPEFQRNYHEAEDEIHWIIINSKSWINNSLVSAWFFMGHRVVYARKPVFSTELFRAVRSMHIGPTIVVQLFMQIPRFSCFVARPSTIVRIIGICANHRWVCLREFHRYACDIWSFYEHFDRSMLDGDGFLTGWRLCAVARTQPRRRCIIT